MAYLDHSGITKSYYSILGVESSADDSEIKLAYREQLLSTHPDKVGSSNAARTNANKNEITVIKAAYKTLIDPNSRKAYDESLLMSVQREGFNISGDGLDVFNLSEFNEEEGENQEIHWYKDCPRCTAAEAITLIETDLINNGTDDGAGGFDIIVQCSSCSLWIKVKYYEEEEE